MKPDSKEHLHLSNDSIQTTDSSMNSHTSEGGDSSGSDSATYIKEVYDYNFIEELRVISELLENYNYIGMDTEFPGTVYSIQKYEEDFYYKTLKLNVDSLKIIQLGITITNENGEYPKNIPYHTWQFNFKFDIKKDEYNEQSIKLLKKSGIDFNKLKKYGIKKNIFAENLMTSGLVLNPDVYWISYHGSYDFGYLLSLLLNEKLPKTEEKYLETLSIYFPNYYDVKMLVKDLYFLDGGLNKLINKLGIIRKGIMHQAGSDSIATIETFLALINTNIISDAKVKRLKNVLYGIGIGRDNINTINYTNPCNNNNNIKNVIKENYNNNNNENYCGNKSAFNMKKSQINLGNLNYNDCSLNNNNNNTKINWFCPVVFFGNYGLIQTGTSYMNNANNNCQMINCNEMLVA